MAARLEWAAVFALLALTLLVLAPLALARTAAFARATFARTTVARATFLRTTVARTSFLRTTLLRATFIDGLWRPDEVALFAFVALRAWAFGWGAVLLAPATLRGVAFFAAGALRRVAFDAPVVRLRAAPVRVRTTLRLAMALSLCSP